eukprot:evm.model.NODE_3645_length_7401_cov_19.625996.1
MLKAQPPVRPDLLTCHAMVLYMYKLSRSNLIMDITQTIHVLKDQISPVALTLPQSIRNLLLSPLSHLRFPPSTNLPSKQEKEARVILCSHLGRPKGVTESLRLAPVAARLSELLGTDVVYLKDCVGDEIESSVAALTPGQVALLENVRFYPEEEKNVPEFAKKLARLAD